MSETKYAELTWDKDPDENAAFRKQLAPIVLITYKRLEHTKRVVEALQRNMYANESDLFVYSDAPKHINISGGGGEDISAVAAVREYLHTITGFKSVTIVEHEKNQGLSQNIVAGVTEVVNKFGKVIVMEDDIVTSKYFLKYLNDALRIYRDRKEVMEITGFEAPIDPNGLPQVFFCQPGNIWGWATWADRWQYYAKITKASLRAMDREARKRFDPHGSGQIWAVAKSVAAGRDDSVWDVCWLHVVAQRNGYTLIPSKSLVYNCGNDGSGTHLTIDGSFDAITLEDYQITEFPLDVVVNKLAIEREHTFSTLPLGFLLKDRLYRISPIWLVNLIRSIKRSLGLRTVPK